VTVRERPQSKKPDTNLLRPSLLKVPDSKILKLLLVEDDLEDENLLCEALIEIEENRQWGNWRSCSVIPADRLADALDFLRRDSFDAVLLNLSLPDSPAVLDSFLEVSACAAGVPILVLADEADENLARRLLREGAQDVLVKSELECAPLARSIRFAIERQSRTSAAQASALVDDLTGVLTRQALLTVTAQYAQLSIWSHMQLQLASVEVLANRDTREPLLIQAADVLRSAFEAPSIIGRWDRCRFCVITAGLTETTVEAMLHHAAANMLATGVRFSVTPLDPRENLDAVMAGQLHAPAKTAILAD
jgi:DNA-binding response OmpR family regulator